MHLEFSEVGKLRTPDVHTQRPALANDVKGSSTCTVKQLHQANEMAHTRQQMGWRKLKFVRMGWNNDGTSLAVTRWNDGKVPSGSK